MRFAGDESDERLSVHLGRRRGAGRWPMPFDVEGVPRRRVELVENGVVNGPVHNAYTAAQDGVVVLPSTSTYFVGPPIASNIFMRPGNKTVEELVASTERGCTSAVHLHAAVTQPRMRNDGDDARRHVPESRTAKYSIQ